MAQNGADTVEEPRVRFPDGESPQLRALSRRLSPALDPEELPHLVLYDHDIAKISVTAAGSEEPEPSDSRHERTGRQLYYLLSGLEPELAELRSGALIRTVVRVPDGALFFYLVEAGSHLYGATSRPDRIEAADQTIARTVNELRRSVRYSELNYGAYSSWRRGDTPWKAAEALSHDTLDTGAPSTTASGPEATADRAPGAPPDEKSDASPQGPAEVSGGAPTDAPEPLPPHVSTSAPGSAAAQLARALAVSGLHYLAHHTPDRAPRAVADLLDHPELSDFFRHISRDQRRERYHRVGALLPGLVARLNDSLCAVIGGELVRVVLDVEQGAIYYHALPDGGYLVGVTVDQERVAEADERLARLGHELTGEGG
ncbi:hypothetical protein [Streptomyces sp. SAJ15]|uniref:hypothetical protein n=1 Tax=Streptomyces sp. SAJ15 TaxID=2011095 RepID=UPI001185BCCD|nr:hypothetical protein [Streptomyces sp. SAJ15]TVL92400.1 hypothetical protein CD790_11965 [Streptomyces sp. SAJ15]